MDWIRGPRIWVGVLDGQWAVLVPEGSTNVWVLVNPGSGACVCAFPSELLPLLAEEEEVTWLPTLTFR